jgi:hypothetical protein
MLKVKPKDGMIDLAADGISQADYLAAIHAIADAINDIRDNHNWCWVWLKFAVALNPLISQGETVYRAGTSTYRVKVTEPRPEDRMPREWFTKEGWEVYDKVNQDGERMKELRKTYGRILQIVNDEHINMDEAQEVFRKAKLPPYGAKQDWKGQVTVYTVSEFATKDILADQEKINNAWKEFLAKTGLKPYDGYPSFDNRGQGKIKPAAKDTEPLIGNPMRSYDPMVMPDGRRVHE